MKSFISTFVSPEDKIRDVLKRIDDNAAQIALVVDPSNKLLGTVTDGDVRRGILKGVSLDEAAEKVMNRKPTTINSNASRDEIIEKMRLKQLRHIPLLDPDGRVVGLEIFEKLLGVTEKENPVVIMAGGLGSRLAPLTDTTPKPLISIGDKPILETIIQNLRSFGFKKFYVSVNYKADMIQDYFGDGSKWSVQVNYLHEKQRMGTAGGLSLLPEVPTHPVIVMNADLLTTLNFDHLLNFHQKNSFSATMCLRDYNFQVPYGVVKIARNSVVGIEEKPAYNFFVNAGIYVLEPKLLSMIPKDTYFDMTNLFESLVQEKQKIGAFPIREYWIDIGQLSDLETANGQFSGMFKE